MRVDPCGCFPTGRHYPGIAHLIKVRAVGVAPELDAAMPWLDCKIAFLDVETTGRDSQKDRVIELGIVIGRQGEVIERHGWMINPGVPVSAESSAVHGIKDADLVGKPAFHAIVPEVVPRGFARERALARVSHLADNPRATVAALKRALREVREAMRAPAVPIEREAFTARWGKPDHVAAMKAFRDRK